MLLSLSFLVWFILCLFFGVIFFLLSIRAIQSLLYRKYGALSLLLSEKRPLRLLTCQKHSSSNLWESIYIYLQPDSKLKASHMETMFTPNHLRFWLLQEPINISPEGVFLFPLNNIQNILKVWVYKMRARLSCILGTKVKTEIKRKEGEGVVNKNNNPTILLRKMFLKKCLDEDSTL